MFTLSPTRRKLTIVPRAYQTEDIDESFRQWDAGITGTLTRIFTGGGKTPVACMCLDRWLERGDEYRGMVISYEQQLVWQFAQEIEAFMGITPAIEMGTESVTDGMVPQIVVASRQSLSPRPLASQEQREHLAPFGITEFGLLTSDIAKSLIGQLRKGLDKELALAIIENHNANQPIVNHEERAVSRIYKYPSEYNWLVIVDEAHKSSLKKTQTAHWFNWFGKNPHSRRKGLTATPKRSDKVSIGTLFHGITIDYPLYSITGRCAVKDGYAVPYVQKYIEVEGVDFKQLKKVKGDYDEAELERVLAEEHTLASFCGPTLDLVGDRRTLVFSPTVAMAQAVTGFINARTECKCHACNAVGWYPRPLIGDGATCRMCNAMLHPSDINEAKSGPQAACIYGEVPKNARKETYRQHQEGAFQFLSVCGLCLGSGTRILTDVGEVPIEHVTTDMKLWDGVEFVSHDGVISKGVKPVMEYAGLTATGGHNVWTDEGWVSLAACKQQGLAIRVGGIEGKAVCESAGYYRGANSCWQSQTGRTGSEVRRMWSHQHKAGERNQAVSSGLQKLLQGFRYPQLAFDAVSVCKETMREFTGRLLQGLRRSRNQIHVCIAGGYGQVDHGEHWTAQGLHYRPNQKQRTLRAWQHSMGEPNATGKQSQAEKTRVHEEPQRDEEATAVAVYDILNAGPRSRFTANGLIVSNCREGYNDPDVSCVAVFRPVSKEASSLAEQMKGRASRPLRGLIEGMETADQRLEAIRTSRKPDALIIDLVGITGLADCATTIQIYAEGLPDHVIARAEEIALTGGVPDIQDAIQQAQREDEEEKERKKQERLERQKREQEEAERRSKAQAEARYTEHERGNGTYGSGIKGMASEKQLKYIHFLGMDFAGWEPTISQAGRIITQLKEGMQPSEVAYKNGIAKECWSASGPSVKQMRALARMGINAQGMTPGQVQEAFSSRQDPRKAAPVLSAPSDFCGQIRSATGHAELTEIGLKIMAAKKAGTISDADFQRAVELGREQRSKVF